MLGAQQVDGRGRGRVAGDHQRLYALVPQMGGEGARAGDHMGLVPLAIGRVAAVGDVDEVVVRQLGAQRSEDAEAAYAAVKNADRPCAHN